MRPCAVDISREAALVSSGLDSEGYVDRVSCVVADVDCVAVVSIIAIGVFETPVALISVAYDLLDGAVSRTACEGLVLVVLDERSCIYYGLDIVSRLSDFTAVYGAHNAFVSGLG